MFYGQRKRISICIVSEDKIYNEGKRIPPNDVKKAVGNKLWVQRKYDSLGLYKEAKIYTVLLRQLKKYKIIQLLLRKIFVI